MFLIVPALFLTSQDGSLPDRLRATVTPTGTRPTLPDLLTYHNLVMFHLNTVSLKIHQYTVIHIQCIL